MTSRRNVIQTIASAAVAVPLGAQHVHQTANALVQIAGADYKPKFFSNTEFETLKVLVDLIIPRTDTPGAADAGVHRLIDTEISRKTSAQKGWRAGLAFINSEGGKPFLKLTQEQQIAVLRGATDSSFFRLLKGAVVDLYYTTPEGLKNELGWNANTYLPEFKGCTHKEHQS
jgi:Gluconate 2-dehydrogenase subunit 3